MVVSTVLLCLALLLSPAISRAADQTNASPSSSASKKSKDGAAAPGKIENASEQDQLDAAAALAAKYLAGNGVAQDSAKALHLLAIGVTHDNARSEACLAIAFANGVGVPQDNARAMDWMTAAAIDNCPTAQCELGRVLGNGSNRVQNISQAFQWICRAANQGDATAEGDLGALYEEGVGTKPDLIESFKWFQLAVDAGNKDVISRRDEVAALMDPSQKQEALLRAHDFKPDAHNPPFIDDSSPVECPLGDSFQIPVNLFGKTNWMFVDTGASCAVLDASVKDRLGSPFDSRADFETSSSTTTVDFFNCPEIFIGEKRFAPLLAIIGDFGVIKQVVGEPISGVLGLSCLKYHVFCFDSDNDRFSIGGSVPQSVRNAASPLALVGTNQEFYVSAFINGHGPIQLMIDSGDNSSLDLNEKDWQTVFAGKKVPGRTGQYIDAGGKPSASRYARVESLKIGTNEYKNILTGTIKNPNASSHLGESLLRRSLCYFDFPNRQLYMIPGRHFNDPEEQDMSGLHVMLIDGQITVYSVDDDSPASATGIKPGDQILALNEKPAASFHLMDIRETLKAKPGNEIKMRIQRGSQTNEIHFRLKRFL